VIRGGKRLSRRVSISRRAAVDAICLYSLTGEADLERERPPVIGMPSLVGFSGTGRLLAENPVGVLVQQTVSIMTGLYHKFIVIFARSRQKGVRVVIHVRN